MSPVSDEESGGGYIRTDDGSANENNIWEENDIQSGYDDDDTQAGADPSLPWETNLRLPRSVIPVHYDLYLFPDLESGMFSGKIFHLTLLMLYGIISYMNHLQKLPIMSICFQEMFRFMLRA